MKNKQKKILTCIFLVITMLLQNSLIYADTPHTILNTESVNSSIIPLDDESEELPFDESLSESVISKDFMAEESVSESLD